MAIIRGDFNVCSCLKIWLYEFPSCWVVAVSMVVWCELFCGVIVVLSKNCSMIFFGWGNFGWGRCGVFASNGEHIVQCDGFDCVGDDLF